MFWHIGAIILTAIIVVSNFDWRYFLLVHNNILSAAFFPAILIGFFLPLILPLWAIISGYLQKNKTRMLYGLAIFQAVLGGWLVSVFYKSLTGRVQPDITNLISDSSHNWNFGFWKHGIFWGWPSSHTTVAFSMVTALIFLSGKKKSYTTVLLILYAFYVGIAVSFRIHWFSEFVAGAIIGTTVGVTVGKYWKEKLSLLTVV